MRTIYAWNRWAAKVLDPVVSEGAARGEGYAACVKN
jgi:hypothetical protein